MLRQFIFNGKRRKLIKLFVISQLFVLKIILRKISFLRSTNSFLGMSVCFNCNNCINSNPTKSELFNTASNQGRKTLLILILNIYFKYQKNIVTTVFAKIKDNVLSAPQPLPLKMFNMDCTNIV